MKKLKHFLVLLGLMAFGLLSNPLSAQISEGGIPPSFAYPDVLKSFKTPVTVRADFDVQRQLQLDRLEQEESWGAIPLKVGKRLPVNLSIESSGDWSTLPDGTKIWRLTISSPDAVAIMLYYDEFYIPEEGKLFIYNDSKSHVLGAYTSKTNPDNRVFATEFVQGDKLTLEYVMPPRMESMPEELPKIKISDVVYGYANIRVPGANEEHIKTGIYNDPENTCMVNVNCSPEGDSWQVEKRGVAATIAPIISQPGYVGLCSGTMINNTAQDLTPYYLTAWHCFEDGSDNDMALTVFHFHYETPGCTSPSAAPTSSTVVGAEILASINANGGSDGQLLRLLTAIPMEYGVYYNGWDRRNTPAESGVGIHHPGADVKKISTFTSPAIPSSWNASGYIGATDAHWRVQFVATPNGHSVTKGGSSGSPLFNQDGLVVGTLTGGNSSCTNLNGTNQYGKLWYHWDQDANSANHLNQYLDPLGTGQETLNGTYTVGNQPAAIFNPSSTSILVFQSVRFINMSAGADTYEWTFEGGTPSSSTEKNPPEITYNAPGDFTAKLVINKGTASEAEAEVTINVGENSPNPQVPEAIFSLGENTIMTEGFDDFIMPPSGWTLEKPGASASEFVANNMNSASTNFTSVDPTSTSSALVQHDASNVIDTWLKSPAYSITSADAYLEFYTLYRGTSISGGILSVYISTDGVDWSSEVWTNGPNNTDDNTLRWYKNTVDLAAYDGQDIYLGFRYYGQGGYFAGFDGVKIAAYTGVNDPITINVGDYVSPKDRSTGPPLIWDWTFDGGDPSSSNEVEPRVRYMTPGVYDITLMVKNYRGEHTRTFTGAVTVLDNPPVAAFEVEGGYTRQSDYALFIPTGIDIDFVDQSENYPTAWSWTFEGGNPATSAEPNPTVRYEEEGLFDVDFEISNTAASDALNLPDYVYAAYDRQPVWNMLNGEIGNSIYQSGSSYVTGTNSNLITMYAERFDAPLVAAAISKIDLLIGTTGTTTSTITVRIDSENSSGYPGTTIKSFTIPFTDVNPSGYTTLELPEPVIVNDAFFITVSGVFTNTAYQAYITSSVNRGNGGKNTAYLYDLLQYIFYGNGWYRHDEYYSGLAISMNIVPTLTYVQHDGVQGEKKFKRKNIDDAVATIAVKSNIPWTATTSDGWIEITNGEGDGDGSFTFKVTDNTKRNARNGVITVSAGGSYYDYIFVQQAGPNPNELTAFVSDEETGEVGLSWQAPEIIRAYVIGDDIFDDLEEHPAWKLDSPNQYVGWSFIDGDGETPYWISYSGEAYPNYGIPSSFIVYNPSKTTPATTEASFAPHSGNQYFACPSNIGGAANNDWLVSPELGYPGDFTFSFWAKSQSSTFGYERMRVAYSTTTNTQAAFNANVLTTEPYLQVPITWTKYEFTIPADAKYVAINCVSEDAMILMVDDIYIGTGTAPQSAHAAAPMLQSSVSGTFSKIDPTASYTKEEYEAAKNASRVVNEGPVKLTDKATGDVADVTINVTRNAADKEEKQASDKLQAMPQTNGIQPQQAMQNEDALQAAEALQAADAALPTVKLRYDTGVNSSSIGASGTPNIEVAIRFAPADIINLHGAKIKAVDIYLREQPADGIRLNIRRGDEIIYTQNVASVPAINEFVRIGLTEEVLIDASDDLYVGYEYNQQDGMFVAGVSTGPAVINKGDLISLAGSPFESIGLMGLDYNWNIAVLVEDNSGIVDLGYRIYRNQEAVADSDETSTIDMVAEGTGICYQVTSIYNGELESILSNISCVTLKNPLTIRTANATRFVNEANPNFEVTVEGDLLPGHTYDDIISLCSIECLADELSAPGTYPITINPLLHNDYRFAYEHGTLTVVARAAAVSDLTATVVGSWNVNLRWSATPDATSYKLYRGTELISTLNATGYTDSNLAAGSYCYTIVAVDANGVESAVSNEACVTIAPHKVLTNAFTPYEKDGINDIFLPGTRIEVVNRYGQSIFNGNNGWDGTRKGEQLVPPGTYYYKAILPDGSTARGSVEVIKKK